MRDLHLSLDQERPPGVREFAVQDNEQWAFRAGTMGDKPFGVSFNRVTLGLNERKIEWTTTSRDLGFQWSLVMRAGPFEDRLGVSACLTPECSRRALISCDLTASIDPGFRIALRPKRVH